MNISEDQNDPKGGKCGSNNDPNDSRERSNNVELGRQFFGFASAYANIKLINVANVVGEKIQVVGYQKIAQANV